MHQKRAHLADHIIDGLIDEKVAALVEFSPFDPRADREDRSVRTRHPAFGQSKGENEYVKRLEHLADARQMLLAVEPHLGFRNEAPRLHGGPEGVQKYVFLDLP